MRIIVCGSRDYDREDLVFEELDDYCQGCRNEPVTVVHGAARGADALASRFVSLERAARDPFRTAPVTEEGHPADWEKHGKGAGPIRNREMAAAGAVLCLAFWDGLSRGTADMISTATRCGIPVRIVPWRKP